MISIFQRPRPAVRLAALLCALLVVSGTFVPLSAQRRPDLDRLILEASEDWGVPGFSVAVVQDGRVVHAAGYGFLKAGGSEPVDERTLFAIASNTKAFTAASLALLVEEGALSWDDRVVDHLPYFRLYDPWVTQEMRIRDLLSHRSGLGIFSGDLLWWGTGYSSREVLERARFLPAAGSFRASYGYSNLMFIAAGEVVAAVTGTSWTEFVERRILEPVGMTDTVMSVTDLQADSNAATPHGRHEGQVHAFTWQNWDNAAAAGGILSSAADMARWMAVQLSGGKLAEGRLWQEATGQEMWTPHTPIRVGRSTRELHPTTHLQAYGLGWSLRDYQGRLIVGHGGAYDGMFSRVTLVPEEGVGIVVLTNSMTSLSTALSDLLLDHFLGVDPDRDWSTIYLERDARSAASSQRRLSQRLDAPDSPQPPSLPLGDYAGVYGSELYDGVEVTHDQGRLVLAFLPNPALVADLVPMHLNTFVIQWRQPHPWFEGGVGNFILDDEGRPRSLELDVPNDDFWFHELVLDRR